MHPTLKIAIGAAKKAGQIILRYHNQINRLTIDNKAKHDFISEVDKMAEDVIISEIKKYFPKHSILAEESGETAGDNNQWIIDPLDGTTNYLHNFPQYSVSIAMSTNNELQHGVVYDPFKSELFSTTAGSGVMLNNNKVRVSQNKDLNQSLIGTGFPFKQPQHLDCYLDTFRAIHPQVAGIRRAGSAALDLAYIASGRLDGFWEIGLNKWDIAAGVLLIQEAGGFISDFAGGKEFLETGNIVAGNTFIYPNILSAIQPYLSKELRK